MCRGGTRGRPFLVLQTLVVLFSNSVAVLTDREVVWNLMHQLQRVCLSFRRDATYSQTAERLLTAWLDQMINLGHESRRVHSINLPPRPTGCTDAALLRCQHNYSPLPTSFNTTDRHHLD